MITTVTLNPSIDKAYYLEKPMVPGTVMRVKETINNAGGKGINVAKNVKLCGAEVVATGFVGGFNGQYLEHLLAEKGDCDQLHTCSGGDPFLHQCPGKPVFLN